MNRLASGLEVLSNARRARADLGVTRWQAAAVGSASALIWLTVPTATAVVALALAHGPRLLFLVALAPFIVTFLTHFITGCVGSIERLVFRRGGDCVDFPFWYLRHGWRYLRN